MGRWKTGLLACESGASAVEAGLVMTIFLGFLYGIVNFGLVLWTQASLHFAVQAAARCASVNSTTCGSTTAVQSYALAQYHGQPLGGTNPFTYTATGCGHTVRAAYTYSLSLPFYGNYSLPLSAAACFP
jgi:Flp pilus assembly protein TadG